MRLLALLGASLLAGSACGEMMWTEDGGEGSRPMFVHEGGTVDHSMSVHDYAMGHVSAAQVNGVGEHFVQGMATVLSQIAEAHGHWHSIHYHAKHSDPVKMGSFLEVEDRSTHGLEHGVAQDLGGQLAHLAMKRASMNKRARDREELGGYEAVAAYGDDKKGGGGGGAATQCRRPEEGSIDVECMTECAKKPEDSKEREECEEACTTEEPDEDGEGEKGDDAKKTKANNQKMQVLESNSADDPDLFATAELKTLRDVTYPTAKNNMYSADDIVTNLQFGPKSELYKKLSKKEECEKIMKRFFFQMDEIEDKTITDTLGMCGSAKAPEIHAAILKVATGEKENWKGQAAALKGKVTKLEAERQAKVDAAMAKMGDGANKGGFGKQIQKIFKEEVAEIKKGAKDILAFFKMLTMGIGWGVPITIKDLVNPKLPGLAITCLPIKKCVSVLASSMKGVMRMIFAIIKLPIRVLFAAIKAACNAMGLTKKFMKLFPRKKDKDEEKDEKAVEVPEDEMSEDAKKALKADDPFTKTDGAIASKTESKGTGLVPKAETKSKAGAACGRCPMRITMGMSLGLMDVFMGFGINAFSFSTGLILGNAATAVACAKGCVATVLNVMNPFRSRPKKLDKVYWQETCNQHTVGMCLMLAKTRKCSPKWKELKDVGGIEHPLKTLASTKITDGMLKGGLKMAGKLFKKKPKADPKAGRQICELFEGIKSKMVVRKNEEGALTCEKDNEPGGDSCPDKKDLHCGELSMEKGCELVHRKMVSAEKDGCLWEDLPENDSSMFDRCIGMFGCFQPDSASTVSAPTYELTPDKLMGMVRKHMRRVDYIRLTDEQIVAPEVAAQDLMAEIQAAVGKQARSRAEEQTGYQMCRHDWKAFPSRVFRSPMWSGRCLTSWAPEVQGKNMKAVMTFAADAKGSKDKLDAAANKYFMEKKIKFHPVFSKPAKDPQLGQIFNRGILLAEMVGATGSNVKVCECHCCYTKAQHGEKKLGSGAASGAGSAKSFLEEGTGEASGEASGQGSAEAHAGGCRKFMVGRQVVKGEGECTSTMCHKAHPQFCPGDSGSAAKPPTGFADGANHPVVINDASGMTCEETAEAVGKMVTKDGDTSGFEPLFEKWGKKQAGFQASQKQCAAAIKAVNAMAIPDHASAGSGAGSGSGSA